MEGGVVEGGGWRAKLGKQDETTSLARPLWGKVGMCFRIVIMLYEREEEAGP